MAEPVAVTDVPALEFSSQWDAMKHEGGFQGKVELPLLSNGLTVSKFRYPAGKYSVQSSEHWCIGIVRKSFELKQCAFGSATTRARDISPSELIVAEPNAAFEAQLKSEAQIDYIVMSHQRFLDTLPDDAGDVTDGSRDPGVFFSSSLLSQLVHSLLERMARPGRGMAHYSEAIIDAIIAEFIDMRLRDTRQGCGGPDILSEKTLSAINAHIVENIGGKIDINDLAQIAGLNASHFRSSFKAQTQCTPYQFILKARVTKARDILATTNLPCAKVAFECGFSSQSHMTDVFRQRLGKTPRQVQLEK